MSNSIFSHDEVASTGAKQRLLGGIVLDSWSYDHYGIIQSCSRSDDYRFNVAYRPIARLNGVGDGEEHCRKKARREAYPNPNPNPNTSLKLNLNPIPLTSLRLLSSVTTRFKRLTRGNRIQPSKGYISIEAGKTSTRESAKLSVEETIRLAGEMLLGASYSRTLGGLSCFTDHFHLPFSGLSEQEIKNVQLAQFLLAAAEKISQQKFEAAGRFLNQCDYYSDDNGNPVERVVYYFSEALRERIDWETGRVPDKGLGKKRSMDMEKTLMTHRCCMASHEKIPFSKINQFAGIQAIIENVIESKKIHIIDLGIRVGMQWVLLMEALAMRQDSELELLKITAVGTRWEHAIEETCKRLKRFAESKKVPFCYKIVMVSDFLDLKEELLEVEHDETVAIFSAYVLRSMLAITDRLEYVMKTISKISPVVMVIIEADANHNSPVFAERFIEALFFFSAYFDCLGECLSDDEMNRKILEGVMFGEGIRNMVAREGNERNIRNVRLKVWRAFLERFGPEEAELSMSSLYQANLLLKAEPNWRHNCTLEKNGKSLVICWKGVPINAVSVWKFQQQRDCY